jgi:SseB protein C-terminal domain
MNQILAAVLILVLSACSHSDAAGQPESIRAGLTPYDYPSSPEWSKLDGSAKAKMRVVLSAYPDVKVAYLLKHFDDSGRSHFALNVVFDGEANSAALDAATAAFALVAPADKKLEIMLFTPETQAQVIEQANATPFYVRQ